MRFIIMLALLAFPVAEIWILISLAHHYGWWVAVYLIVIALLGLQLIRDEKLLFSGRMMQSLTQGGNPLKAMFGSARNIIAGILLIIPGVITDIIAVILLLIPIKNGGQNPPTYAGEKAANDDVIEGEFRRED
ncbi:phage T7 F exclusion suppressor FxsA [mine drainage metagenome]|uniref:Phage T7 F exclusion suppressor FxsA n=1 Tax=mine drainage metagenome TaxID=410659 RepID=A0A1J5RLJ0_9ZZZZ